MKPPKCMILKCKECRQQKLTVITVNKIALLNCLVWSHSNFLAKNKNVQHRHHQNNKFLQLCREWLNKLVNMLSYMHTEINKYICHGFCLSCFPISTVDRRGTFPLSVLLGAGFLYIFFCLKSSPFSDLKTGEKKQRCASKNLHKTSKTVTIG